MRRMRHNNLSKNKCIKKRRGGSVTNHSCFGSSSGESLTNVFFNKCFFNFSREVSHAMQINRRRPTCNANYQKPVPHPVPLLMCPSPCSSSSCSSFPYPLLQILLIVCSTSSSRGSCGREHFFIYLLTYFLLITLRTQSCIYLLTRSLTCFGCMSLGTRATYISEVEGCSTGKSFRFVRTCVRAVWLPSRIGSPTLLVTLFSFLSRTH